MLKIKFTPFVLFLILLVVLVISVLFGYKNKIFEGAATFKSSSYKHIVTVNGKDISVDKSSGSISIKDTSSGSYTVVDSTGHEEHDVKMEGNTTQMDAPEDAHAFVYEDKDVIIPYINYGDDIYLMVIDHVENNAVASYTYAKGKENVHDGIDHDMEFHNIKPHSSSKSSDNTVSITSDIDIDMDKDRYKINNGKWHEIRTKKSDPQIIDSEDGSYVVSMEGTASTSNYVVFALYMKNDVINMDSVILKYDTYDEEDDDESDGSHGKGYDMSKYVPKTWLNPSGCPRCPSTGDCKQCGNNGTPGSTATTGPAATSGSGSGSGSTTPGQNPGFGNNLVDKTTGVANNAIGGATALGLGAALGATVLGASAVGGATSLGNNAIGGATNLGTSVAGGAAGLGNNAIGGAAGLGNNAIGGATKLGQGVTNAAGQAVGTTGNVLNNTVGTAGGVVNNAVNKLTGLAAGLGTGTKDLLQSGNRTNLQQGQQGQQGQIGANGQTVQGQYTQYGQLVVGQPPGQQYGGYQMAFPVTTCGTPIVSPVVQTSDYVPSSSKSVLGTGGNYTSS